MTLSHRCSHCSVDPSLASNATSLQYSNASVFMPSHCAHHHASEITLSHPRLHCADDPLMNDAVLECLDFPAGLESVRYARIDAWEGQRQSIPVNAHHTQSGTALTVTATTLTVTAGSSHSLALSLRTHCVSLALLTHWLFSLTGSHWLSLAVKRRFQMLRVQWNVPKRAQSGRLRPTPRERKDTNLEGTRPHQRARRHSFTHLAPVA